MTLQDLEKYRTIREQIAQLHIEISELSRKKPNDEINKFKLKFINQLVSSANNLLTAKFMPFSDFTVFSEDELPSNSDITMILSQYLSCLERYRVSNIKHSSSDYSWYWVINGKVSDISSDPPKDREDLKQ